MLARRVLGPLKTLREGAERIGRGDLSSRLELATGDEFESLADEFNRMAASLEELQQDWELKIDARTSELAVANQKLREASEHKSRFLANVNHELRTPVSAIIGFTRLVLRKSEGQIRIAERDKLQKTLITAERLLEVINGLLDFAKIEAGRMELLPEHFRIDDAIQTAAATIEPMLNGHVRLVREVQADMPALNTDRKKLEQILINLLVNAAKFTERGEIKIAACCNKGLLNLAITDSGAGMSQDALTHIFEEFHQGSKATARKYGGTGLGLAIVRRLVDVLGGEIVVNSTLGVGSTFNVRIPLHAVPASNRTSH